LLVRQFFSFHFSSSIVPLNSLRDPIIHAFKMPPIRNQSRKHILIEQVLNTGSESFMLTRQSNESLASALFHDSDLRHGTVFRILFRKQVTIL
jgi:hypothetical protein